MICDWQNTYVYKIVKFSFGFLATSDAFSVCPRTPDSDNQSAMENTATHSLNGSTLRMADPRLPMTVSRAAIELDRAARGETVNFEATLQFTRFLHESLEQNADAGDVQAVWLDANTVDVVGHALQEFKGSAEVRTVKDVFDQTCVLVSEMEGVPEVTNEGELTRLRRFCVAFGNSLLARRNTLRHDGPINPHKR